MNKLLLIACLSILAFPSYAQSTRFSPDDFGITADGSTTTRDLSERFADTLHVKDYGAVCDGVTDDSAAITAANTAATSAGKTLVFPQGTCNVGNASFIIDAYYTQWISDGGRTILSWSSMTAEGYAIRVMTSFDTYYHQQRKWKTAIEGIHLSGGSHGAEYSGTGLDIYGDSDNILNGMQFNNIAVYGFTNALNFENNVWFVTFNHLSVYWGSITTPSTYENFGETMVFNNCFFGDSTGNGGMTVNHSIFRISNSSFDNYPLILNNDAQVAIDGGHFENPGAVADTHYFAEINNEAALYLNGTSILHNAPSGGSARTKALFKVNTSSGSSGGLFMNNVRYGNFSHADNYNTLTTENHYVLAEGTGPVTCHNCSMFAFSNYQYQGLGAGANQLQNQGIEGTGSGSTAGWYQNTTWGGTATHTAIAATSAEAKTGSYSLALASTYTSGAEAYRSVVTRPIPVKTGDVVTGGMWRKGNFTSGTGHIIHVLRFYDSSGAEVTGSGANYYSSSSPSGDWQYWNFGYIVPAGAVSVSLQIAVGVASGTVTVYVDEARLDIIRN